LSTASAKRFLPKKTALSLYDFQSVPNIFDAANAQDLANTGTAVRTSRRLAKERFDIVLRSHSQSPGPTGALLSTVSHCGAMAHERVAGRKHMPQVGQTHGVP